jgi:hypothetical protein
MSDPRRRMNVHRRGKIIDGNYPHITLPTTGKRFSAVFFHMKGGWKELKSPERQHLRTLGFPLPRVGASKCTLPRTKDLPEAARILRKKFALTNAQLGDYKMLSRIQQSQR